MQHMIPRRALVRKAATSTAQIREDFGSVRDPVGLCCAVPVYGHLKLINEEVDAQCTSYATINDHGRSCTTDKINAQLQDGTTLTGIDFVHIATGYEPYPDFTCPDNTSLPSAACDAGPRSRTLMRLVNQNPHPESGTRVPSLHRHILYAYNPTLAFIGSPMSFTPFTVNDVSSLSLLLVWSHAIPLFTSPPEPFSTLTVKLLQFERDRLEGIRKWREDVNNPSALYSYGVLGASEEEFANGLRKAIVDVMPKADEWSEMKWALEAERKKWRERMYPIKLEALRYARDHAKI
ncbi:hypothetical protein NP233_g10670 [Leucocoprinus birnbaumii]|uniref:Uncharacterized protein n=1 Tax=Leucocoprinus birnbaumii TaxID=56174 RepID=A0AAD5VLJ1_9AGAR|nr:hypothetical protein NP233_g10670 [Leucocoprinus birnbaumii]